MNKLCLLVTLLVDFSYGSGQLQVNSSGQHTILIGNKKKVKYEVQQEEETNILNYPYQSTTIGIELLQTDGRSDNLCSAVQHDIIFADYNKQEQLILPLVSHDQVQTADDFSYDPHRNDPGYFLSNPILVNMVHTKLGIAAVTSDHRLIVMNIIQNKSSNVGYNVKNQGEYDFTFLRSKVYEHSTPQIVYDPISDYLYLIYSQQIIYVKVNDIAVNSSSENIIRNISSIKDGLQNDRSYVGNVRVSKGHMFVPVGSDGLDIYKILLNGDIEFKMNIEFKGLQQSQVVDAAIGGDRGQHLYILDRLNGITLFHISDQEGSNFLIEQDLEFDIIPIKFGIVIKEFNNRNLFILCQRGRDSYVEEIGIHSHEWYKLRTHYLSGRYFDIDVTAQFAILRGVDAHRIIYHSIWEGFQQTQIETWYDTKLNEYNERLDEEYLFLPKLQSIEFFSADYGFGDPNSWHYNQTHPFLLGMTTHQIVELPFVQVQPYVRCKAQYRWQVGQKYTYKLMINTTQCKEKNDTLENQKNGIPYLLMCVYEDIFTVHVTSGKQQFSTEELFSITIGLSMMVIMVATLLAFCFQRFKKQKVELSVEISGFENKGYVVDQQDPQQ